MTVTNEEAPLEYTSVEALEAEWRPLTDEERDTATARLRTALVIVRAELPDVDERVVSGVLASATVGYVLRDMVRRSMQSATDAVPEGAQTMALTSGPFTRSFGFGDAGRDGALYLSKANRRMLGRSGSALYAIDLL